jgi:putative hydrolase of the HAD superfamily
MVERSSENVAGQPVGFDAVVFDLGGVLARPVAPMDRLARVLGPDVDGRAFAASYWAHRDAYDLGSPDAEYWGAVADGAGAPLDPGTAAALARADAEEWTVLAEDSLLLIEALRRQGLRLGLLSNAPLTLAGVAEQCAWSGLFERLVFSAREGLPKPEAAAYERATELLGLPPARVVFFDDRAENAEAARRHGWEGHVWTGAEQARAVLTERKLLPRDKLSPLLTRCDTASHD